MTYAELFEAVAARVGRRNFTVSVTTAHEPPWFDETKPVKVETIWRVFCGTGGGGSASFSGKSPEHCIAQLEACLSTHEAVELDAVGTVTV